MLAGIAEVAGNELMILASSNAECITTIKFNSKTKRAGYWVVEKPAIL